MEREIDLPQLTRWLALEPARLAGLNNRKGSIEVGMDADFVVWDPDGVTRVRGSGLEHRHPNTPYEGMSLRGSIATTILAGVTVYDGASVGPIGGRMLRRNDRSDI